ncbi:MAG: ubiquitin-conjugating enzyme E2 variant [Thermoplasmatota archaeon]
MVTPWFADKARLDREVARMAQWSALPGVHISIQRIDPRGQLWAAGHLRGPGAGTYHVLIRFPPDYPLEGPDAMIPSIRGQRIPHAGSRDFYNDTVSYDGSICAYYVRRDSKDRVVETEWSSNYDIDTMLKWLALWIAVYENWKKTGVWASNEVVDHLDPIRPS